jgi:N-acetyl-anhydromuramyl-L-alanine amidase AmpD
MRLVDWVVVHTAGAYDFKAKRVVYQSTESIREYHKKHNGWHDIGYHWVIEDTGRLMPGRTEDTIGAHVGGFNERSIGICVTGHGDFAPFLPTQMAQLVRLCAGICGARQLPSARVIGHREAPDHGAARRTRRAPACSWT